MFIRKVERLCYKLVATSDRQPTLLQPQLGAPHFTAGGFRLAGAHFGLLMTHAYLIAGTTEHNTDFSPPTNYQATEGTVSVVKRRTPSSSIARIRIRRGSRSTESRRRRQSAFGAARARDKVTPNWRLSRIGDLQGECLAWHPPSANCSNAD